MKPSELLSDPSKWCQHDEARKSNGDVALARDPEACQWCAVGAMRLCYPDSGERYEAIEKFRSVTGAANITDWNDSPYRTFDQVRGAFIRAGM